MNVPMQQTRMDGRGRVVIPAEYRRALGMAAGDPVVLELREGVLRLQTRAEAIRQAQELVTRHAGGKSLVRDLTSERLTEAAGE